MDMSRRRGLKASAFFIVLTISLAVFAGPGDVIFFVEDFETAVYDLDAKVPEDALHYKGHDTPYSDGLFYMFDSKDGMDFFCHTFFIDVGYTIKTFGIDYKVVFPDGRIHYFGRRYDADESSMAGDRFEWKLGPNYIKGDHNQHVIHIDDGPCKIHVTMKTVVPFYQPGDKGRVYYDTERKKRGQYTHFPLFTVTGTVKDGATVTQVDGWGLGNRVHQNFLIPDSGFHTALRWQEDGLGFEVYDYQIIGESGQRWFPILMVYDQGKMIHVSQRYNKKNLEYYTEPRSGIRIPSGYRIVSKEKDMTVQIEFTNVKMTDYNDPLIVLGKIERYLIQLFFKAPLDLRFDGHVKMSVTTPSGTVTKEGPGHGLALTSM